MSYFKLLEDCTLMEAASLRKTPECEYDAYRKIIDYADIGACRLRSRDRAR